jgi:hypothetical protein
MGWREEELFNIIFPASVGRCLKFPSIQHSTLPYI